MNKLIESRIKQKVTKKTIGALNHYAAIFGLDTILTFCEGKKIDASKIVPETSSKKAKDYVIHDMEAFMKIKGTPSSEKKNVISEIKETKPSTKKIDNKKVETETTPAKKINSEEDESPKVVLEKETMVNDDSEEKEPERVNDVINKTVVNFGNGVIHDFPGDYPLDKIKNFMRGLGLNTSTDVTMTEIREGVTKTVTVSKVTGRHG